MTYKVIWNQWTRSGYHGDDTDCETMSREFKTLDEADTFGVELIYTRKHRGMYDMSVNPDEVRIEKIES